jgi:prepilin-type N-terminal cleavage/methylation domain-containing protein
MKKLKKQEQGFTLVELAIVLVIIGLLLGGVLKGKELINNAKAKRLLNDLRGVEALTLTFYDRYNRMPGDGNLDGLIDGQGLNWGLNANYDDNPANVFLTATNTDPDAPWAELQAAKLVSQDARHRVIARHTFNGGFFIEAVDIDGDGRRDNIILVENVPCFAAKTVDTAIDGEMGANTGNIIETTGGTISNQATWTCSAEDDMVEFVYLLDK